MKDQFVIFYCKENKIHPVVMNKQQLQTLQDFIPVIFQERTIEVLGDPCGEIYIKKIEEQSDEKRSNGIQKHVERFICNFRKP